MKKVEENRRIDLTEQNAIEKSLQAALSTAENELAMVSEQLESAKAKLLAADQKRRALALAAHTGVAAAHKALKAATSERDDVRILCEDLELAISAAKEKRLEVMDALELAKLKRQFAAVVEAGLRQTETLEQIVSLRNQLFAACARFQQLRADGRALFVPVRNARRIISEQDAYTLDARFTSGDDVVAKVLADSMPYAVFRCWPQHQYRADPELVAREFAFWRSFKVGETENEHKAAA